MKSAISATTIDGESRLKMCFRMGPPVGELLQHPSTPVRLLQARFLAASRTRFTSSSAGHSEAQAELGARERSPAGNLRTMETWQLAARLAESEGYEVRDVEGRN